ncbi:MAG: hypothetical protein RR350_01980 [Oscillibacter sp.]
MWILPYLITGVCVLLLAIVWLVVSQRRLSRLKNAVTQTDKLFTMHRALSAQARDGPNAQAAARMLESSRNLYHDSVHSYHDALKRPTNRLPALLLGFHPIGR